MNTDFNVWDKLTRVVIFLLFIAYLLVVAVWYLPLIHQNERMRKEILRHAATAQQLQRAKTEADDASRSSSRRWNKAGCRAR
jgi:hypothetical protein